MIPNILWQTWKIKNIPTAVKLQYNTWSVSNTQLTRNLFDDKECATFILQHFGREVYQKYINLPQSIMRADF